MVKKKNLTSTTSHEGSEISHVMGTLTSSTKYRVLLSTLGVSAAAVAAISIATTHGLGGRPTDSSQGSESSTTKYEKRAEGSSATTVVNGSSSVPSSLGTKPQVIVNNQQVDVPTNGSISKTIVNDNGTTRVDITNNSNSSGTSVSTSVTSNDVSTSTNDYSHDVNIRNFNSP